MAKLFSCPQTHCESPIFVEDVVKRVRIVDSPQFLAVVYKCPACATVSKGVVAVAEWDSLARSATRENFEGTKLVGEFVLDLEYINSVADLCAYWRSYRNPPIIEELIGRCNCADCRRKLYVAG